MPKWIFNGRWPLGKPRAVDNMLSSVEVDVGDLSAFVINGEGQIANDQK